MPKNRLNFENELTISQKMIKSFSERLDNSQKKSDQIYTNDDLSNNKTEESNKTEEYASMIIDALITGLEYYHSNGNPYDLTSAMFEHVYIDLKKEEFKERYKEDIKREHFFRELNERIKGDTSFDRFDRPYKEMRDRLEGGHETALA